jgi:hypothetical protein
MSTLGKYPIDFDVLEKGSVITQQELEEIFLCTPEDYKEWPLKLLGLSKRITDERGFLTRVSKNTIVVMDDEEAAEYNDGSVFQRGLRKMRSAVLNLRRINTANLSPGAASKFESRSRVMVGTLQAATAERKKLERLDKLLPSGAKD